MTGAQMHNVQVMHRQGLTPTQIAKNLGVSLNTVKSYCRRNNLSATSKDTGNEENKEHCKHCGKTVPQTAGRKQKLFCDDTCRNRWWNENRQQVSRRSLEVKHCHHCGKLFSSYPRQQQKYCCHGCYVLSRFGKGVSA